MARIIFAYVWLLNLPGQLSPIHETPSPGVTQVLSQSTKEVFQKQMFSTSNLRRVFKSHKRCTSLVTKKKIFSTLPSICQALPYNSLIHKESLNPWGVRRNLIYFKYGVLYPYSNSNVNNNASSWNAHCRSVYCVSMRLIKRPKKCSRISSGRYSLSEAQKKNTGINHIIQ